MLSGNWVMDIGAQKNPAAGPDGIGVCHPLDAGAYYRNGMTQDLGIPPCPLCRSSPARPQHRVCRRSGICARRARWGEGSLGLKNVPHSPQKRCLVASESQFWAPTYGRDTFSRRGDRRRRRGWDRKCEKANATASRFAIFEVLIECWGVATIFLLGTVEATNWLAAGWSIFTLPLAGG